MNLSIGIVGLPNVGKSTLFKALTKKEAAIADYPFTTINPNVGVIPISDQRLQKLKELLKPERALPAVIEVVDIAGLVKNAHRGEGLGNQFLSQIYGVDAILFLLGAFRKNSDAASELDIIREELRKKDEEITKRNLKSAEMPPKLSEKPSIVVCNISENAPKPKECEFALDAKLELEISVMSCADIRELGLVPGLARIIGLCYQALDLITFYTIKGGKELRAWPIKNGGTAPKAGGIVHSDFEEKFIRAEVVTYDDLISSGSWAGARERGRTRTEGREYIVKDGDIIEFKI